MSAGAEDKSVRPDGEAFLDRWTRRKAEARRDADAERPAEKLPAPAAVSKGPPELPPVEKLDFDSDYRAFFHPKVGEDTRRAALKRLFSDARFNIMDGLDVYIDDYSKSDPIPPAMLAGLRQAQNILRWAKGEENKAPTDHASPDAIEVAETAALEPAAAAVASAPASAGQEGGDSGSATGEPTNAAAK